MYHSVAEPEHAAWIDPANHVPAHVFAAQMAYLARHRRVIALSELVSILQEGRPLARDAVVITFDDGYRDNLSVAASVLAEHGLPATLFLPSGYIDRAENQWVDQLYAMFKHRTRERLVWEDADQRATFDLTDPMQRKRAYEQVRERLLIAEPGRRREWLDDLAQQLQPEGQGPRLTMDWNEVRALLEQHAGFEIGGHTVEHRDLTHASAEQADAEVAGCRQRIVEQLGVEPAHFSFPYSRSTQALRERVAGHGFVSACASAGGHWPVVGAGSDPVALQRVEVRGSMRRFPVLCDSANVGFWRRIGG